MINYACAYSSCPHFWGGEGGREGVGEGNSVLLSTIISGNHYSLSQRNSTLDFL